MRAKAKFHYAIWFEAGSKMVADSFEAGRGPVGDQLRASFEPDSVTEFNFEPVCDQLRAGSSYLDMLR